MSHTIKKTKLSVYFDKEEKSWKSEFSEISYDELELQTKLYKLRCVDFCFHYDHMKQTCHIEGSQLEDICPFFFCTWYHEKLR